MRPPRRWPTHECSAAGGRSVLTPACARGHRRFPRGRGTLSRRFRPLMISSPPPFHPLVLISSLATGGAERVTVSFARGLAAAGVPAPLCTVTARDDGPLADELAPA